MPKIAANGLEFEYDEFGKRSNPPMLLVMGLGAQMITWDDEFCQAIAGKGFRVIRYDNRDIGLSSHLDHHGMPDLAGVTSGEAEPPYTLDDMAADGIHLLQALGIDKAHVVGASMGGMIVQLMAINHPQNVLSLTSIMSTTGRGATPPTDEAMEALTATPQFEREAYIEQALKAGRVFAGPSFDEAKARDRAARSYDRSFHPIGFARQYAAILAAPSRVEALARLNIPTLVIHGKDDTLVPPDNGLMTHQAVPDAELMLLDGMGHNIPENHWDTVATAIAANAAKARVTA